MSGNSIDAKASIGLANSLSNVFKLADVTGLCWVRYTGPTSSTLEAPQDDPVLKTYARLLSEGYACAWRRLSPSTDGQTGEAKDLWLFYFTDQPDIASKMTVGLEEADRGNWKEEMTNESTTMLYRALHSLIERSLLSENFLPLGKWFARPDSSVATDGSSRGCFLCGFSFFVHAHLYVCASVDMRAGPALQPLLPSHVSQALASSTGLQVILSPSGLNAVMTGHSYTLSDVGIDKIIEEWKLFFPRRFNQELSLGLPAAIEVVVGGVRMRYPSQFVLVYHGDDSLPTPPPSPLNDGEVEDTVHEVWESTHGIDTEQQYKDASQCHCQDTGPTKSSGRRHSSYLEPLPLKTPPSQLSSSSSSHRYEPYSRRPRGLPAMTPVISNTPQLNVKRKLSKPSLPMYSTTPVLSPSLPHPLPTSSHNMLPSSTSASSLSHRNTLSQVSLPPITLQSPASVGRKQFSTMSSKPYNPSFVSCSQPGTLPLSRQDDQSISSYHPLSLTWSSCLPLPTSTHSLSLLQLPSIRSRHHRDGFPPPPHTLSTLLSPAATGQRRTNVPLPSSSAQPFPPLVTKTTAKSTNGPQDENFDPSHLAPLSADSPVSITDESHPHGCGAGGTFGMIDGDGDKRPGLDELLSKEALKIDGSLDQIFEDSEEEEEEGPSFTNTSSSNKDSLIMNKLSLTRRRIPTTDPIAISKIYPTPPSVETTDKRYDEVEMMEDNHHHHSMWGGDGEGSMDDEMDLVPCEFTPLRLAPRPKLPAHCTYTMRESRKKMTADSEICFKISGSKQVEPQTFIFPPPSTLNTRSKIESLTLPLSSRHPLSHLSPHHLLTSSPATHLTAAHTSKTSNHFLTSGGVTTTSTPIPSPLETVTPTPISVPPTANRLVPVLPEAHALYVNLALLDSALGSTLSEPLTVNTTTSDALFQKINKFISNSRRLKLDSVAAADVHNNMVDNTSNGTSTDYFNFQEEKPIMTFGITDYPSLGFREDMVGPNATSTRSWAEPFGCLSRLIKQLGGGKEGSDMKREGEKIGELKIKKEGDSSAQEDETAFPLVKFLEVLQDYAMHLCLTASRANGPKPNSGHAHLMGHPLHRSGGEGAESSSCRLYHSHSVISAILSARQLVTNATNGGGKKMTTPLSATRPAQVELSKQENSASWILDLLTLPTKFIIKRLKELRYVFQHSFHTAPCLKFSTKGPLSLRDLQQLAVSHTALGDECSPVPMQPMVVGHDHEWLQVSPLAIPAWDKLMLEPYALKKTALYLVLSPPSFSPSSSSSSSSSSSTTSILLKFFHELSIIYRNCNLGQHVPLEKGAGKGGLLSLSTSTVPSPATSSDGEGGGGKGRESVSIKKEPSVTADPHVTTRHGPPAPSSTTPATSSASSSHQLDTLFKKILVPILASLPTSDDFVASYTSPSEYLPPSSHQRTPPLSIIIYVICKGGRNDTHLFQLMHTFSEILENSEIPEATRRRILLQPLDSRDLLGPKSGHSHQLRSLAFSIYSRALPTVDLLKNGRSLTFFGPIADKKEHDTPAHKQVHAPPYILSPAPSISSSGPLHGTQMHQILFSPDEAVLFCGYCVSPDQRWLLAACCDRQGELMDSTVIGIQAASEVSTSRKEALQKLWGYICSVVADSIFRWNIVITRFGKPSNSEIRDWPTIVDDGLLDANQLLRSECDTCHLFLQRDSRSVLIPKLLNVMIVSVQPERNIHLYPTSDSLHSVSHVMVLPQDHRAESSTAPSCMTPGAMDEFEFIGFSDTGGGGEMGGFQVDDSLFEALDNMDILAEPEAPGGSQVMVAGAADSIPKAVGYLISTSPPGYLPEEFWGYDRSQSNCSMFKVSLHLHITEKAIPDSAQETLGSVLLCFNALSWLTIDHSTSQRRSCLPLHLHTLAHLHRLFSLLDHHR